MTERGAFARYGIESNRWVVEEVPQLRVGLVMAPTFEEASRKAKDSLVELLDRVAIRDQEIRWIYHPHNSSSFDPYEWFGSWGVRWIEKDDLVV